MVFVSWHDVESDKTSPNEPDGLVSIQSVTVIDAGDDDQEVRISYKEFINHNLS